MEPVEPSRPKDEPEVDELVEFVAEQLARCKKKHAIKHELEQMLDEPISSGIFERLMQRARKVMLSRLQRPKAEWKCEALDLYRAIIADPDSKDTTKIVAQERIDKLLGLEHQFTATDSPEDLAARARRAMREMQRGGAPTGTVPEAPK